MSGRKNSKLIALTLAISIALLALCGCGEQMARNYAKNSWSKSYEEQIEANNAYLSKYPDGEYAKEAKVQLEAAYIGLARKSQTIDGYKAYLESRPEGEYADEARIAMAALGQGFPEAAAYDRNGDKPVRIIIIKKFQQNNSPIEVYEKHEWNDKLPADLTCTIFYEAALYVIVQDDFVFYESQQYSNGKTLSGYKVQSNIEIREAKTGEILFTGILEGSAPVFPYSIPSNKYPTVKGSPVSYESFKDWLDGAFQELSSVE